MGCDCGRSERGVWDQRGIAHSDTGCRWTDRYIVVTYRPV